MSHQSTGSQGPNSNSDFGKALIQAMDDFAHSTTAPTFDPEGMVRRARRRRGMLALASSGAVIAATAVLVVAFTTSPERGHATAVAASTPPAAQRARASSPTRLDPPCAAGWPTDYVAPQNSVAVPNVTGLDQPHATAALTAAGLRVALVHLDEGLDGPAPTGAVVCTSPIAGTRVAPGESVSIFVAHY
ncbi:PASTA domain-containing protein [Kitasatospora sp. NPDC052896]|uniref:PASTA domain-containing protein n=1 Tax=Kitasatospora sp. NPDC052896 TaxID=3364061 RepID=UPI0037C5EA9A